MLELHLKIYGDVTDVNFRYYAQQKGRKLGLTGWVRNAENETVEILAQGEKENLEKLLAWAKVGPPRAQVKKVETAWQESLEKFDEFEIRPT